MNQKRLATRPDPAELTFQLFDRPMHPELIESLASRVFECDDYRLRLDLTPAGHTLHWRWRDVILTEVLADQNQPLPETRQLFAHRVGGERNEQQQPCAQVLYQTCFQVERMKPEVFFHQHDMLLRDGAQTGVLHLLHPIDRLNLSPLSFVDVQARPGSLLVHVYHTFPDDYAVVKSQTLIDLVE